MDRSACISGADDAVRLRIRDTGIGAIGPDRRIERWRTGDIDVLRICVDPFERNRVSATLRFRDLPMDGSLLRIADAGAEADDDAVRDHVMPSTWVRRIGCTCTVWLPRCTVYGGSKGTVVSRGEGAGLGVADGVGDAADRDAPPVIETAMLAASTPTTTSRRARHTHLFPFTRSPFPPSRSPPELSPPLSYITRAPRAALAVRFAIAVCRARPPRGAEGHRH